MVSAVDARLPRFVHLKNLCRKFCCTNLSETELVCTDGVREMGCVGQWEDS
jgi:hypothetical protein